jgi:hypothetical protein
LELNYQYASPSVCLHDGNQILLGLSPDLSREERVSFVGKLKYPLIFREAMLVLREIVIADMRIKKKGYEDFFIWLNEELDNRMSDYEVYLKDHKENLQNKSDSLLKEKSQITKDLGDALNKAGNLRDEISKFDIWYDYDKLEPKFWKYIRKRDEALWYVLDPVITVHPDQVSFEAFSLDESIYGCLSVNKGAFEINGTPQLGTTNIDFSTKLADEIERFRTYNDVELSINPEGFKVDGGVAPEHLEKKIDLPESWIKGFNQVSAAATLGGYELEISQVDMYDICSFLRRNRARKSPRAMKWVLEPKKRIKIIFEPWGKELTLSTIYKGERRRVERIWGRRRWLILERILPITKSFKIRFFGFGMPQFIIADLGPMILTFGFTSWSANDWVKGTAFNILAGFIAESYSGYDNVYKLLKTKRVLNLEQIKEELKNVREDHLKAGIGLILRRGEAYYDPIINSTRFRQLLNIPIPKRIYERTEFEKKVQGLIEPSKMNLSLIRNNKSEVVVESFYETQMRIRVRNRRAERLRRYGYRVEPEYRSRTKRINTSITLDQDGQIIKVKCRCKEFNEGPRNISAPCSDILALYIISINFMNLPFEIGKKYNYVQLEAMAAGD